MIWWMAFLESSSRQQIVVKLELNTDKFVKDLHENQRVNLSHKGVNGNDLLILCSIAFDRLAHTQYIKSLILSFNNLGMKVQLF